MTSPRDRLPLIRRRLTHYTRREADHMWHDLEHRLDLMHLLEPAPGFRSRIQARPTLQMAALTALALAVVCVLSLLTPPGQAVAEWLGARVGIGEVGGEPSLVLAPEDRKKFGDDQYAESPTVIDVFRFSSDKRYELLTWRDESGRRCISLETLEGKAAYRSCAFPTEAPNSIKVVGVFTTPSAPTTHELVFGWTNVTSSDVRVNAIRKSGEPVRTRSEVSRPPRWLSLQTGLKDLQVFVAELRFPPNAIHIEAEVRGRRSQVISSDLWNLSMRRQMEKSNVVMGVPTRGVEP